MNVSRRGAETQRKFISPKEGIYIMKKLAMTIFAAALFAATASAAVPEVLT